MELPLCYSRAVVQGIYRAEPQFLAHVGDYGYGATSERRTPRLEVGVSSGKGDLGLMSQNPSRLEQRILDALAA